MFDEISAGWHVFFMSEAEREERDATLAAQWPTNDDDEWLTVTLYGDEPDATDYQHPNEIHPRFMFERY